MKNLTRTHRRAFIKSSVMAAAGMGLSPRSWAQVRGANDDGRFGVLGFKGRGRSHITDILAAKGARIVALCDVYQTVLDAEAQKLKDLGHGVKTYTDVRQMLESSVNAFAVRPRSIGSRCRDEPAFAFLELLGPANQVHHALARPAEACVLFGVPAHGQHFNQKKRRDPVPVYTRFIIGAEVSLPVPTVRCGQKYEGTLDSLAIWSVIGWEFPVAAMASPLTVDVTSTAP
jgi:hypothetical protein